MPYNNLPRSSWGKMDSCVSRVQKTGKSKDAAIAICYNSIKGSKKEKELDWNNMSDEQVEEVVTQVLDENVPLPGDEQHSKEQTHKKDYVPYGITSFGELDQYRAAQEQAHVVYETTSDFTNLVESIMYSPDVADKSAAIMKLADEFSRRVKNSSNANNSSKEQADTLPDSAFLYAKSIEKGDADNSPLVKRLFPYKNTNGAVDLVRLREAIALIPQSDLPKETKESLLKEASLMLNRAQQELGIQPVDERDVVERVVDAVKSLIGKQDPQEKQINAPLFIWKEEDGSYKWAARFSNNYRDDDNPAEIISEKSHIRFVEMVDKGQYEKPELWLWHRPEWKCGQATGVAYDDSGFAIATGYFDKGKEYVAEWLSKQSNVAVSRAMPRDSIARDNQDPSVILEHQTVEISPLPLWAAANKLTGFVVLDAHKEADMAIPQKKRNSFINEWGIDPALLDKLEQQNAADAAKAKEEGRDSKEKTDVEQPVDQVNQTEQADDKEAGATTPAAVSNDALQTPPTREEIADAFGVIFNDMKGLIEVVSERLSALESTVKELKETDDEKVAKAAWNVPTASLGALLSQRVVGKPEAVVDGRSSLAKSKPKEAATVKSHFGIPFIDQLVSGQDNQE